MQITINTDTDDLPAVIRMLQAYAPPRKLRMTNEATGETIAEFTPSTVKITNDPIDITDDKLKAVLTGIVKSGPDHKIEIPGTPADQIYTGAALQAAVPPPCSAHAQEDDEPTPEQVFAAPKSLFDAYQEKLAPHGLKVTSVKVTPGPVEVSDVTVDAAGLPWDARIHSGAKSKLANGNWKLLRGVDPALVASVEAF